MELLIDVAHMSLDREGADLKFNCDFFFNQTLAHKIENLHLPR